VSAGLPAQGLTPDECLFIAVYTETLDRAHAVEVACPDVPATERHYHATRLLSRPHVATIVRDVRLQTCERLGLGIDDVVHGLLAVISDPVSKPADRVSAWKAIGKMLGFDTRRHQVQITGPQQGGVPAALIQQIQRHILGLPAADEDVIDV
jgi:hypothetical protein